MHGINNTAQSAVVLKTVISRWCQNVVCMGFYGKRPLLRLEGKVKAANYAEMLSKFMLPEYDMANEQNDMVFQQDNASCHSANLTKAWFVANLIGYLKWLLCSPDMSPTN